MNSAGTSPQSAEASATPQAAPGGGLRRPGRFGDRLGEPDTISVRSAGRAVSVAAGHTLVVSLLLSTTSHLTTAVTATDSAGNSYVVARDTNDGSSGDRTVVLVSVGVKALAAGASITLTYPSSAETHVSVDEFSGITGIDTSAGATGTTAAFSSGAAPATTQATDVLVGTVGIESGKTPTWAAGWTALPVLAVSSDFLDTAYQLATAAGSLRRHAARPAASGWPASSPSRPADAGGFRERPQRKATNAPRRARDRGSGARRRAVPSRGRGPPRGPLRDQTEQLAADVRRRTPAGRDRRRGGPVRPVRPRAPPGVAAARPGPGRAGRTARRQARTAGRRQRQSTPARSARSLFSSRLISSQLR